MREGTLKAADADSAATPPVGAFTVFVAFLRLGLTSFGGPVAHIGFFRDAFVARRRWIGERAYADLVALCQFLPGPASSQVGMGIGLLKAGIPGALAAWAGFTLPSAILMIAAAYGVLAIGGDEPGWLAGLKIAAVAVVAQAVIGMTRSHASDIPRIAILVAGAAIAIAWPAAAGQIAAILAGAIGGFFLKPDAADASDSFRLPKEMPKPVAIGALALFGVLLVALPALAATIFRTPEVMIADASYRAGALVFGGGHVVLPLLESAMVVPGWVSENAFLAGYGIAQAVPGPLFSFGAYLGAAMEFGPGGGAGAVLVLTMLFLPSFLLVVGVFPFWDGLRRKPQVRRVLAGVNAAVVGLLLAALWDPVIVSGIHRPLDAVLALAALAALMLLRMPPWLVVAACAAAGAGVAAL
ncbi:MAG: chromate efflux transporter [Bauldia sp.]